MASTEERKGALQSFMSTPQSMDACCNLLHLHSGSQVHRDLVHAIVQVTGYGKKQIKPDGLLEPCRIFADGSLSTKFNDPFAAVVENFLEKLKAGILFFPVHLPDHPGWDTSFWPVDRLEWRSLVEREDIRVGILLMFEHIKNNGVTIDVMDAAGYQSFTTDDCNDCGSCMATEGDDIVYCKICRVGHHQSCYGIYPIPKPEEPWYCKPCYASKEASAARKRKRVDNSKKTTSKTQSLRFEQDDSDYFSILSSPRAIMETDDVNVPRQVPAQLGGHDVLHGETHSSSSIQEKNSRLDSRTSARRAASHPAKLLSAIKHSDSRKALASIPPPNPSIQALDKERTPSPELIISHEQLEVENNQVEIVGGSSADFRELLRMVQKQWDIHGIQVVYVKLVLLAAGEAAEF